MVVYSILLMDLSPTSYCLPKPLTVIKEKVIVVMFG